MEPNNQNLPTPELIQLPQQPKKWYRHKGLMAIAILATITAGVSYIAVSKKGGSSILDNAQIQTHIIATNYSELAAYLKEKDFKGAALQELDPSNKADINIINEDGSRRLLITQNLGYYSKGMLGGKAYPNYPRALESSRAFNANLFYDNSFVQYSEAGDPPIKVVNTGFSAQPFTVSLKPLLDKMHSEVASLINFSVAFDKEMKLAVIAEFGHLYLYQINLNNTDVQNYNYTPYNSFAINDLIREKAKKLKELGPNNDDLSLDINYIQFTMDNKNIFIPYSGNKENQFSLYNVVSGQLSTHDKFFPDHPGAIIGVISEDEFILGRQDGTYVTKKADGKIIETKILPQNTKLIGLIP